MIKKKLSLLLATVMTSSVLTTGFSNAIIANAQTTTITQAQKSYNDRIYLSEKDMSNKSGNVKKQTVKLLVNGSPISFSNGIFAHAHSVVQYDVEESVEKGFDTFITYMGIDYSQVGRYGDVSLKVESSVNGNEWDILKEVSTIKANENSIKVEAKLKEGTKFIRMTAGTNGPNSNDHAVYGDPLLANSKYFDIKMPTNMKSSIELDKELVKIKGSAKDVANKYALQLNQREFVDRVGYDILEDIYRNEPEKRDAINFLFGNEKAIAYFIETGNKDSNDSLIKVLDSFYKIYSQHKNDLTSNDVLLKLAIATAWASGSDIHFWAGSIEAQDPVGRYEVYKDFLTVDGQAWSWTEADREFFKSLSPAMMKYTVNARMNNDEMKMMLDYMKNYKDGSMNGYHYIEYKGVKNFDNPAYYGNDNFKAMDEKYHGLLSKYDIDITNPKRIRYHAVMEIDGVCGAISKTYTILAELLGRPAGTVGQPGHAAAIIYNPNTHKWEIGNNISGWDESHDEMNQMPLSWGKQPWNSGYSASYVLLAQNVLDNYDKFSLANRINILAEAYGNVGNTRYEEGCYVEALKVQPNNLDSMYGLIKTYQKDKSKTSINYISLARDIVEDFKFYPLAMCDLLALIENNTSQEDKAIFDLIRINGLRDSADTTNQEYIQGDATKEVANYLLTTKNTKAIQIATFSFDGDRAGEVVMNSKYGEEINFQYSVDGGESWVNGVGSAKLSNSQLDSITDENNILVRIPNYNDEFVIDIKSVKDPTRTVFASDLENKLLGTIANLEYSENNGQSWKAYAADTKFEGDKTIQIRYGRNGVNLQSSAIEVKFTDSKDLKRSYISVDNVIPESIKYTHEQNAGSSGKHMLDGNDLTGWHTKWNTKATDKTYQFELKESKLLSGVDYVPQASGFNGRIAELKVEVSTNGADWKTVVEKESFARNNSTNSITFKEPVYAKFVKFTALKTYGNSNNEIDQFVSGAGWNLYEDISDRTAPTAEVSYSVSNDNTKLIATLKLSEEGKFLSGVTSNNTVEFTTGGSKVVTFEDLNGNKGQKTVLCNAIFATEENTQNKVRFVTQNAGITGVTPTVTAVLVDVHANVVNGKNFYIFEENGTHIFEIQKADGTKEYIGATVNSIVKPNLKTELP
ncbi:discoidin domain-containing protein [uncultured Clostridium sp.]|uniref:discoidin domain-containing protein n=1 Tax=uncultured Clostridium sp. TaxID=59620 RepID=UPI0025DAFC75|nr:discoidin domain-containing protein [uncultured Clostridium sp.]